MQPSQLNSFVINPVGSKNPATLTKAAQVPLRVAMVNVGPILILLAHDDGTLINVPAFANTYQLRPDKELIVVLIPGQGIYAAGVGEGAQLSVAISEAIPTKWMEG